ncbi:MAG TPA: P-II family nitrogen regulator [Candidatus Nitrosotalea sp.]|nr:P-II family nitrogen regulator [Candidatus Nitrosotalea sp.]
MIKIEIILPENDVRPISDALKKLSVGGITAYKGWGRGKTVSPQLHASKGTEIFTPEFGERFIIEVIVPDDKKNEVIEIARSKAKLGKIFVTPISEAFDIPTEKTNEQVI